MVGYKLAKPVALQVRCTEQRLVHQFTPFVVTILGVVFTDLLTGVAAGHVP
jgi:MFS superfamily sulfate permease-like transporter